LKIFKNSFYNVLGLGLPLIAAIFSIPFLVAQLGDARFGLLTLVWAITSYFGLFDLGLGRVLTQRVTSLFAQDKSFEVGKTVFTALVLMFFFGLVAGICMVIIAPFGTEYLKQIPNDQEVKMSVYWMAFAMPAIILTSGMRGVLEARHAFGIINLIRIPMGLLTFFGPVLVVILGFPNLTAITAVLSVSRILACVIHFIYMKKVLPCNVAPFSFDVDLIKPLCKSGGWMTLSNLVSPLMGYVDRFMLGIMISAAAVAYYVTPQEIVTKIWIIPGALTSVLFPTFAAHSHGDSKKLQNLFGKSIQALLLVILPITLFLVLFANEIMDLWIGTDFSIHSAILLKIFAFGIFINCLAHIPFTLIQGIGQSKFTALVHCAIFPIFCILLWWLIKIDQERGAAVSWLIRIFIDLFLMFIICNKLLRWPWKHIFSTSNLLISIFILIAFSGVFFDSLELRVFWYIFVSIICSIAFYKKFMRDINWGVTR